MVLGLGAHYRSAAQRTGEGEGIDVLRSEIFNHLESIFLKVVAVPSFETVQIGILYGSYNLFNGYPNLGFGILGSTVKIAQVLGLHKSSTPNRRDRKEGDQSASIIWWALEVFDKYPLHLLVSSVSDKRQVRGNRVRKTINNRRFGLRCSRD